MIDKSSNCKDLDQLTVSVKGDNNNPFARGIDITNIEQFRHLLATADEDLSDSETSCSIAAEYNLMIGIISEKGLGYLCTAVDIIIPLMQAATLDGIAKCFVIRV